jgi:hypothetical protein
VTRTLHVSDDVAEALGADGVRAATDPMALRRVRCAVCGEWADSEEQMELILMRVGRFTRVVATHPDCQRSQIVEIPAEEFAGILPAPEGSDVYSRCMMRVTSPRSILAVDMAQSVLTFEGAGETRDAALSLLLEDGFALYTDIGQELDRVDDWRAEFEASNVTIGRSTGHVPPLYSGEFDTTPEWLDDAKRAGEILLVTGTHLGLRDGDRAGEFEGAMRSARVVAARVPAHFRAPTAARAPRRNDPCPCGSGRKFKLCHGR